MTEPSQAAAVRRMVIVVSVLGEVVFVMMTWPLGDACGHLNCSVVEKLEEEYRLESHGIEVIMKS